MTADPHLTATAEYAHRVFARVESGEVDPHTALAVLACDTLALSMDDKVAPQTADALLDMACQWATARRQRLLAERVVERTTIPDTPGDLDGGA